MKHEESIAVQERRAEEKRQNGSDMIRLAEEVERYHTQPFPRASVPVPEPFPPLLWQGLAAGIAAGGLVGLVFAYLLLNGVVTPAGWEGLFSLWPSAFYFVWAMLGAALGLLVGGVGTLLLATPRYGRAEPDDQA